MSKVKVQNYKILRASDCSELARMVDSHLNSGYELSGGLILDSNVSFLQAVYLPKPMRASDETESDGILLSREHAKALTRLLTETYPHVIMSETDVQAALHQLRNQYLSLVAPKRR